jgi:hypothetical protein
MFQDNLIFIVRLSMDYVRLVTPLRALGVSACIIEKNESRTEGSNAASLMKKNAHTVTPTHTMLESTNTHTNHACNKLSPTMPSSTRHN